MFERIEALYDHGNGPLSSAGVQRAVIKGWITQPQADQIIGGPA